MFQGSLARRPRRPSLSPDKHRPCSYPTVCQRRPFSDFRNCRKSFFFFWTTFRPPVKVCFREREIERERETLSIGYNIFLLPFFFSRIVQLLTLKHTFTPWVLTPMSLDLITVKHAEVLIKWWSWPAQPQPQGCSARAQTPSPAPLRLIHLVYTLRHKTDSFMILIMEK